MKHYSIEVSGDYKEWYILLIRKACQTKLVLGPFLTRDKAREVKRDLKNIILRVEQSDKEFIDFWENK